MSTGAPIQGYQDLVSHLDAKLYAVGLRCPQPIILTKQAINKLKRGEKLLVVASDPSFAIDCAVYTKQSGNELLRTWQDGAEFYYVLKKGH